ncbi:MAG: hypothetical protein KA767_04310 [Saprospiraceae bacterium]|nr:hypothetical protein [Saprospiraceae bacterium]MBP7642536.1 hypothetical protein [Saprospiraceae bacterium]
MKIYYPTQYIRTFGTGTNKPILVFAIDFEGNRKVVVVKLLKSERMGVEAFLRETMATLIGQKMGISMPDLALVEITNDFTQVMVQNNDEYQRVYESTGLNFGCNFIANLQQLSLLDNLKNSQVNDALKIFYFDVMIQNADRTIEGGKPNLFFRDDHLYILDHELAFSFLFPIIGRQPTDSWIINDFDKIMIENHILFSKLKNKVKDFSCLDDILVPLTSDFWKEAESAIPDDWLSKDFEKIREHVVAIKENSAAFLEQIITLLS